MPQRLGAVSIILLALSLAAPLTTWAADAGRFNVVHGNVDLLQQGKLPTVSVRVDDRVETGDVIRTKANSTAQLTMADGTAIILAPETRLAVVDYRYDQETGARHAVLRLFRGLVHTIVTQVQDGEEPDFLLKTNSANLAVRGTDWYTLLAPEFTEVDLINGRLDVSSSLPALPVAVTLKDMQVTWVYQGHQPQGPSPLSPKTLILLRQVMETGVQDYALFGLRIPPPPKPAGGTPSKVPENPKGYIEKMTPPLVPTGPTITPTPTPPTAP
jgi:hypothetical protein